MVLALVVAARWVHFGALMILFGSALFALYAPAEAGGKVSAAPLLSFQRYGAAAVLLSAAVWAASSIVMMTDDPGSLFDTGVLADFFATQFGTAWIVVLGLLIATVAAALVCPRRIRLSPTFCGLLVCVAGTILVVEAWLGHAGSGEGGNAVAQILAYGVHVLAAAAWLGGLPMLAGVLLAVRSARGSAETARVVPLLYRFSLMGMTAVALVLLSGLANSWFRLASPGALVATPYGLLIDTKFILLCALVIVAALNRFRLMPKLTQAGGADSSAVAALRLNVWIEQVLGAAVLAAAAALGMLSPSG